MAPKKKSTSSKTKVSKTTTASSKKSAPKKKNTSTKRVNRPSKVNKESTAQSDYLFGIEIGSFAYWVVEVLLFPVLMLAYLVYGILLAIKLTFTIIYGILFRIPYQWHFGWLFIAVFRIMFAVIFFQYYQGNDQTLWGLVEAYGEGSLIVNIVDGGILGFSMVLFINMLISLYVGCGFSRDKVDEVVWFGSDYSDSSYSSASNVDGNYPHINEGLSYLNTHLGMQSTSGKVETLSKFYGGTWKRFGNVPRQTMFKGDGGI